jgi:hypothetical protein
LDVDVASDEGESLAGQHGELAPGDADRPCSCAQEPERLRLSDGKGAALRVERAEHRPVGKAQLVGRAGVERAPDVQPRVRAEQDAGRVEQPQVGTRDARGERAVDRGRRAAGHPPDHVLEPVRPSKGHPALRGHAEPREAVEQVRAADPPEVCLYLDLSAAQGHLPPERPVRRHLGAT